MLVHHTNELRESFRREDLNHNLLSFVLSEFRNAWKDDQSLSCLAYAYASHRQRILHTNIFCTDRLLLPPSLFAPSLMQIYSTLKVE